MGRLEVLMMLKLRHSLGKKEPLIFFKTDDIRF